MATRRTTMRSQTGTKLYAVRDESGKFKDIQTYKRAHTADMRHKSKAEKEAAQGPIEKQVRKTADDVVKSVKRSVKGAVAAVKKAVKAEKKIVKNTVKKAKAIEKKVAKKVSSTVKAVKKKVS